MYTDIPIPVAGAYSFVVVFQYVEFHYYQISGQNNEIVTIYIFISQVSEEHKEYNMIVMEYLTGTLTQFLHVIFTILNIKSCHILTTILSYNICCSILNIT